MNVLIIRFSSLGDIVLQTSLVAWLRSIVGNDLKVTFLTSKEFATLIKDDPWIQKVIWLNRKEGFKGLLEIKREINLIHHDQPFDLILDVHGNTRTFLLKSLLWKIPHITVDKRPWIRKLLVYSPLMFYKNILFKFIKKDLTQIERQMNHWLGIFLQKDKTDFQEFIKDEKHTESLTYLKKSECTKWKLPESFIIISPVASFESKRWPIEYYQECIELILRDFLFKKIHIVVLGGPDDEYALPLSTIDNERILYLQGKTSLEETMQIAQKAQACIGNDSGVNHICEAYNIPVVTIFGPTHEAFGFLSHHPKSKNLSLDLWCRPCSTTGSKACYRKEKYCMTHLKPAQVFESFKEVMSCL